MQSLNANDTRADKLTVLSLDRTASSTITVTIHGADEAISPPANQLNVKGPAGNDVITVGPTNLVVDAQAGDDIIKVKVKAGSFLQAHYFDGGSGSDTLDLSSLATSVSVDLGLGIATGSQLGLAALSSIENVVGGASADTLFGNAVANRIDGGAGNDTLTGGAGNDTFIFNPGFGKDTVTDFSIGTLSDHDTLDLSSLAFTSVADVLAHTDSGANAVIHSGSDTITLTGVSKAQLQTYTFDILV